MRRRTRHNTSSPAVLKTPDNLHDRFALLLKDPANEAEPDVIADSVATIMQLLSQHAAQLNKVVKKEPLYELLAQCKPAAHLTDLTISVEANRFNVLETVIQTLTDMIGQIGSVVTSKGLTPRLTDVMASVNESLTLIKHSYESFKNRVISSPPKKQAQLCEPKAQIFIPDHGHFLINATVARKINCLNDVGQTIKDTFGGTHAVSCSHDIYFKIDHPRNHISVMMELMMVRFGELFFGELTKPAHKPVLLNLETFLFCD